MKISRKAGFFTSERSWSKIKKSCKWCGRIHEENYVCSRKPVKRKKNSKAEKFRSGTAWQLKRAEIKKRDKHLCQVCIRGLYDPKYQYQYESLHVHHAISVLESDSGSLDNSNLITLCSEHHSMADKHQIPLMEIQGIIKEQEFKINL